METLKLVRREHSRKPGDWLTEADYGTRVHGGKGVSLRAVDAETGETVFVLQGGWMPPLDDATVSICKAAAGETGNRGSASGALPSGRILGRRGRALQVTEGRLVKSGIVGFFDSSPRFPLCRTTAFTQRHWEEVCHLAPLVQRADQGLKEFMPAEYEAQRRHMAEDSQWRLFGSSFSTVTINRDYRTGAHFDAGDFKDGFGVLTADRRGYQVGGGLILPDYGVCIDYGSGDLLLLDVHGCLHGNERLTLNSTTAHRLSFVLYLRGRMNDCGTDAEELKKARNRRF